MRQRSIIVLLLAILLAIPVGAATWAGRGFYEPDTERDRTGGSMWADAPTGAGQVYFNVNVRNAEGGLNPNVGALGSNHIAWPMTDFSAILGVWTDCNGDGYVGLAEGVLFEYRSELLLSTATCPPGQSPHNDGVWVEELLWIGPDITGGLKCADPTATETDGVDDDNSGNLVDECARVWGDIGLPEDAGAITCPLIGWSTGTFQSTGGIQRYVDCILTYRMYDGINTVADASEADETAGIQIDMHDTERERPDQSGSILNQKNPWGQPEEDSYATVWDCSSSTTVTDPTGGELRRVAVRDETGLTPDEVVDPTGEFFDEPLEYKNEDGSLVAVNGTDDDGVILQQYGVGVPSINPDGSLAGTVNESEEGMNGLNGQQAISENIIFTGDVVLLGEERDCNRDDDSPNGETNGDIYAALESDFEPAASLRINHDITFAFSEGITGGPSVGAIETDPIVGERMPVGGGENVVGRNGRNGRLNTPVWNGQIPYTASRNPYVDIDTFLPKGPQYFTFYASVTPGAASAYGLTFPGGSFVYGAEHCDNGAPTTGLWDCDADTWWRDGFGKDIASPWQVKVGQSYQLRDIDCYDETYVRDQPVTYTDLTVGYSCAR